jgi:hypothetical protein
MMMALLVTYNCPALAYLPETRQAQPIRDAFEALQQWAHLPLLRRGMARAKTIMDEIGI